MTTEIAATARRLIEEAIATGRLAERPSPESLTRIAAIVRPAIASAHPEKKTAGAITSPAVQEIGDPTANLDC